MRPAFLVPALPVLAILAAGAAQAAGIGSGGGPSEVVLVVQIVLLLTVGRLLGEAMLRVGQPAVMGQLLAGILLGPSFLGAVWPEAQHWLFPPGRDQKALLDGIAQLGILLLLLMTGMETDLALVRKVRRAALSVSVTGVAVPFGCGFLLGWFLPETMLPHPELRLVTALFLGTALAISSVKIVAMVVREMDFLRRNVGQVIVASAIIDDTIGWVIIAVIFSLAQGGTIDPWEVGRSLAGTLVFLGLSLTVGRRLVFLLIRWANDALQSEAAVITAILVLMGVLALITQAIGVHTVLGAFVAGLLVGQSPILTKRIDEQLRGVVTALFAPIFFGLAGLSADLTILRDPRLLLLTLGLIAIASLGKFAGAFAGGLLGGLRRPESLALACGMNARGSTEVIVASIGLGMGALSQDLFTMIVAMALITTLAMPPTLRWALHRLPLRGEEKERLEREAAEERGFVANLERLLVAADDGAKGRFAARIAGLVAGSRGMPVTVVRLGPDNEGAVLSGAVAEAAHGARDEEAGAVEVTELVRDAPAAEAVAEEAAKGYDLLIVGIDPTVAPEGGLADAVADAAERFDGPLSIAAARGAHREDPERAALSILAVVDGTRAARRGAEVAVTLARGAGAPLTVLFLSQGAGPRRLTGLATGLGQGDAAALRDVLDLAEQAGLRVRTEVRATRAPEREILRRARAGNRDLIVMGVTRRAGDGAAFGPLAETVLEASDRSVLFLAS
ncbi:cation:proton antiporter [Methylobacterium sp. 17Sr1-1]|uniref:cation:proton antiporter domain-containing protein n=1 Tax=Methylobacterium sp. 17Sr1-1 TaxID=2202826 RepID=UPI000D6FAB92|nr:cation:proton antiporter [Methylobacterium sp. 17Sr1-1]AWN53269.1 potassium transporter [Methylobacterium sp. 17Sr1-1]